MFLIDNWAGIAIALVVAYLLMLAFHHLTERSRALGALVPGETPEKSVEKALPVLSGRRVRVRMLPPEFDAALTSVPIYREIMRLLEPANAQVVPDSPEFGLDVIYDNRQIVFVLESHVTARTQRVPSQQWEIPMRAKMTESRSGWVQWDATAKDLATQAVFHLSNFVRGEAETVGQT
jgi:hypothetical protein